MPIRPESFLAIPVLFLLGIITAMILVGGSGGNVSWLSDIANAFVIPLTLIAVVAGIGFALYQSFT